MAKKYLFILLVLAIVSESFTLSFGQQITADKRIVINIPARTLTLFTGDQVEKIYPVAVGRPSKTTQTPTGSYKIINKIVNPYYSKLKIPGGSPSNPLGIRWLGFRTNYGIHGNSDPKSIGTTASAGCVRMYNYDVKELYEKVLLNTKVDVVYSLFQVHPENEEKPKVLMVYPDVYKSEKDLGKAIRQKLDEEKMGEGIEDNSILEAVKISKSRPVALSKQWVLLVNGYDLISDVIMENEAIYISESALNDYFGVLVERDLEGKTKVYGKEIEAKLAGEKLYLSLEDIKKLIGGRIEKNNMLKNMWYDVSFLKLNGTFLEVNHSPVAVHNPTIPVKVLSQVVGYDVSRLSKLQWINKEPYLSLEELQKSFDVEYNFNSYNKKVEIYKKPNLFYGNKSLAVKFEKGQTLINLADLEINNLVVNDQWVSLDDLKKDYDIQYDNYKLNLVLVKRSEEKIEPESTEDTEKTTIVQ